MKSEKSMLFKAGVILALAACLGTARAGTNGVTADFFRAVDTGNTNYFLGKTGIGTNQPSSTLYVAGDLTVSGAMIVPRQGDMGMGGYTNGPATGGVEPGGTLQGGPSPAGYISGCWVSHADSNTVAVASGDGYSYDQYFCLTNPVNVDITSFTGVAWDWHYIYLNYSGSQFPHSISFYSATNEPLRNSALNGWYHPVNERDRLIGGVMASNAAPAILAFMTDWDGAVLWKNDLWTYNSGFALADEMDPNGSWQTPNVAESSDILPVNASHALVCLSGADAGSHFKCGVAPYEYTTGWTPGSTTDKPFNFQGYSFGSISLWLSLGESRKLRVRGNDDDDNALSLILHGCRMAR